MQQQRNIVHVPPEVMRLVTSPSTSGTTGAIRVAAAAAAAGGGGGASSSSAVQSIHIDCGGGLSCKILLQPLILRLRRTFGTSHSSSSTRTNALFTVRFGSGNVPDFLEGWGEVGLPPKKPMCYLADFKDCQAFFDAVGDRFRQAGWITNLVYKSAVSTVQASETGPIVDAFACLTAHGEKKLFSGLRPSLAAEEDDMVMTMAPAAAAAGADRGIASETADASELGDAASPSGRTTNSRHGGVMLSEAVRRRIRDHQQWEPTEQAEVVGPDVFHRLLLLLDDVADEVPEWRAPKSGMEAAVLDAWSKSYRVPFYVFSRCFPSLDKPLPVSFYTAALQSSIDDIVESAQFGMRYTSHLKIKVDADLAKAEQILDALTIAQDWCIDANASWTPEVAMAFLDLLQTKTEWMKRVKVLEQPFEVEWQPGVHRKQDLAWRNVKDRCAQMNLQLYADESMATVDDVDRLAPYVHGVNVKLEKVGGMRQAMCAISRARQLGLQVWIGIMVSSALGTTQAAQLIYLADHGDLDGALLVHPDRFEGGFEWGRQGSVLLPGLETPHGQWTFAEMGVGVSPVSD